MNCPNCAIDMESNAHGERVSKKTKNVMHTCSECGYSEVR